MTSWKLITSMLIMVMNGVIIDRAKAEEGKTRRRCKYLPGQNPK
jgi:hypothetical protein